MKLYFAPRTRAIRPRWLLEELGVPYELVKLDLTRQENNTPEYLAVHPLGEVPALVDGDVTLRESLASCLYLANTLKLLDGHPRLVEYVKRHTQRPAARRAVSG